ncbi:hypothetical protein DQW77_11935 [Roseovarius sp. TE539]|nr:hypothetical protein DQW77_11935 [Roseovarius sp. TE539]
MPAQSGGTKTGRTGLRGSDSGWHKPKNPELGPPPGGLAIMQALPMGWCGGLKPALRRARALWFIRPHLGATDQLVPTELPE